ncbi:MAG: Ig-like domain-containing protein [Planctomycetes bacterium]|nr:Ig-like domain-containing protein [Planctomycetota bacterium]
MHLRLPFTALVVVLAALAGCGGSSTKIGASTFSCNGADARAICLENCNLGCASTGCARTNIAQNEIIVLQFSEEVDPNSVNPSSIRFRTASGEQPVGEFFVNGKQVEFVPVLSISGGTTFFGFAAGEVYTMTIPGGENEIEVVRSTSGKPFEKTLTCTLTSSLGIVDLNGVPPSATMVSPPLSQLANAPRDLEIVLEFNELIDATPFLSGTASPVGFSVRRTRIGTSGERECDPASQPVTVTGSLRLDFDAARGVSVLSFRPTAPLPGNVCMQITVSNGVQDLSGRPAQTQVFQFLTEVTPVVVDSVVETFTDAEFLDVDASAGTWAAGAASFARIGGDGRHGDFDTSIAVDNGSVNGKRQFTINTDNTIIPASKTFGGAAVAVTDGRFFFSKMVVPSDVRLKFTGANPPVITVAGRLDVLGEIDISGQSVLAPTPTQISQTAGQPGGTAGIFGGAGGKGGDRGNGLTAQAANNGQNGGDARLLAGHAYAATVANSGGRGSPIFPASGLSSALVYPTPLPSLAYTPSATAGGGGGGSWQPGVNGRVVANNHLDPGLTNIAVTTAGADFVENAGANWIPNRYVGRTITTNPPTAGVYTIVANTNNRITVNPAWSTVPGGGTFSVPLGPTPNVDAMGPPAAGGAAVQLFPFPALTGTNRSSLHFLVGGGGGGGAGTHACLALHLVRTWCIGGGGGGGGGAIALRAGNLLRLAPGSSVLAKGGSTPNSSGIATSSQPAPGGAGAGGSVVLQAGNGLDLSGAVDVRGGTGGLFNRNANGSPAGVPNSATVQIAGGDGAPGFVRLEAPGTPTTALLTGMLPPATAQNVAPLEERDDTVSFRSLWYDTDLLFGPEYLRYVIHATVDGVPVVFSDDPAVSTIAAGPGAALRVFFQAATLDPVTELPTETRPWRTSVRTQGNQTGIASDGLTAFRYVIVLDQAVAQTVTVEELEVFYQSST